MKRLFYAGWLMSSMVLAQSIALDEEPVSEQKPVKQAPEQPEPTQIPKKKTATDSLSYVEFRDAKISNVLKLIYAQSGLSCSKKDAQIDLSLKLEHVSWSGLLKIVCNQATP